MEEKGVCRFYWVPSEQKSDSLYPMYFGVSCAFFALRVLSGADRECEKWSELHDNMLQVSAQLLGLLVWRVQREGVDGDYCKLLQKLEAAAREIEELKKLRHEDGKANEKVLCIFAAQEQSWFNERKRLRQQIGALMNELRVLEKKKDGSISELNEKLEEMELLVQSKDRLLEEDEQKRKELEEKAMNAEKILEELRETAKQEAQERSNEIRKHKTAFIELVSSQRQLEAELSRAHKQAEATKEELDLVSEQKEESVMFAQKLSLEIIQIRKDLDQKDKILSAMLRKSKSDAAEKQMLLKEVKLSKVKTKQAELETERWKAASQSTHERHSLRGMFVSHDNSRLAASGKRGNSSFRPTDYIVECEQLEIKSGRDDFSPLSDYCSAEGNDEQASVKRLEGWLRLEAEKYATVIEKRHQSELEAFAEQLRLKDEKLEGYHWRFLSMEIESKRVQSIVEGLNHEMSRLRHENMKLEALLLEREDELHSLKEQFVSQLKSFSCRNTILMSSLHDPALTHDAIWTKDKMTKGKATTKEIETETNSLEISQKEGIDTEEKEDTPPCKEPKKFKIVQSPENDSVMGKDVVVDTPSRVETVRLAEVEAVENVASSSQPLGRTNSSPWRMDLHALGVSYKLKRLKQQLVMLERFEGKNGNGTESNDDGMKGFVLLISFLSKQVSRYQSLQGKIDDLCKRMHETDPQTSPEGSIVSNRKGDTKSLEHFLEETFQLQRYIVSTGQKAMEVQSRIASGFLEFTEELDKLANFDKKRFVESISSLFQEVQRGLEVRIARIIGDLEGTLACEGMIHLRR